MNFIRTVVVHLANTKIQKSMLYIGEKEGKSMFLKKCFIAIEAGKRYTALVQYLPLYLVY